MVRAAVALTCVALAFLSVDDVPAQETTSDSRIDWETNSFTVDLQAHLATDRQRSAADLYRAQTRIEQEFPGVLFSSLLPLPVDSRRMIEDAVRQDPDLASRIADLAEQAERGVPRPSADLRTVSRTYRVPLFPDLTRLFVNHTVPFQMERVVRWVPTRDFTGIVIYAAEPLPVHGTMDPGRSGEEALLVPALFPQIYDTNLRPVLEQDMVDPEAIRRWGVVHYTDKTTPDAWRERAGTQPLRIMARRAFGIIPTDIMISPEDADRILASDHNRDLLRQGRVVVIVPPEQIERLR
tara:strand:- start:1475 stop:2359 length:885 start_codon:yes stop_codon:yes gene_type:complete